jgi:hypothetical protein
MAEPWVAGATPPDQRLIGWTPKIPPGLPVAGSISPGDAGNVVFAYVKHLRDMKIDPMTVFSGGFPDITGLPPSYMMHDGVWTGAYDYATIYLLAYYANGPLPEDQIGELGTAPNWPDQGDNLEQQIFGWAAKTIGWDGYVRHYELRKVLQVQKWSNKQNKWVVYNQWGQDLTYNQDPITQKWSAGADVGTWLNAHGAEIFAAYNAVFSAIAAMTGYGAVIGALQASMKALAITAATGNFDQIVKAIGNVAGVMAGLPGVAEFGAELLKAGGAVISDVFVGAVSRDVITAVLSAEGKVETVVGKTKELMQFAEKNLAALKQAGIPPAAWPPGVLRTVTTIEADIKGVRENMTPDHLKPWFDRAVAKGRAALADNIYKPGQPVPYYAKGTWDQALSLGTMVNVAKAIENPVLDMNALTPQQKRAIFLGELQVNLSDPNAVEFLRQANLWWFKDPKAPNSGTVQDWADYYKLR